MGYQQYTSAPLFSIPSQHQQQEHHLSLHAQAQPQPPHFNPPNHLQDLQEQEQNHQGIQGQPQGQLQPQVHQQLEQDQLRQLQLQHNQNFLTDLTVSPYILQQVQQTPSQTPTLGFAQPSAASPPPWDSPESVFGGGFPGENAQFGAASTAMNVLAAASMMAGYDHGFGRGRENMHTQQDSANLIPPITTLDVMDRSTPGSATSALTPLSTTTASPVAVRSEFGGQDVQPKQVLSESEDQQEHEQVQYEHPRVIQLVERPPRKSRVQARDRANQQQNPKAQASTKSQTQAKVQAQRQNQNGQREAKKQFEVQTSRVQAQTAGPTSSRSVSTSPVDVQKQQSSGARQSSTPQALVTAVPSSGQWYGIHALAAASQQRVTSTSTSPPSVAKGSIATNGKQSGQGLKSLVSQMKETREAASPYPPRLKQRRSVSGPAALTGAYLNNGAGVLSRPLLSNAPSPTPSLPVLSPASLSPIAAPSLLPGSGSSPPTTRPSTPRYLVRTDVHYDIPTNTLTAMLEVPGVPREAIRIALGTDARNGVRMVIVRGHLRRVAFPSSIDNIVDANKADRGKRVIEGADKEEKENVGGLMVKEGDEEAGYVVKERKCGDFKRVLVVPPETKIEDVKVAMADGILFLRYPAGEQNVDDPKAQATIPNGNSHTSVVNPSAATARQQTQVGQSSNSVNGSTSTRHASTSAPTARPAMKLYQGQTTSPEGVGGMQINFRVQTSTSTTTRTTSTPGSEASSGATSVA